MNYTDEQRRLLRVMKQFNGKCPMTTIRGLFHGNTITNMMKRKLIEVPLFGGWYLLTEAGREASKEIN